MSNEAKKVEATPKGIIVSADKLMSVVLERSLSDRDQTIGAYKETINNLKKQNGELEGKLKAAEAEEEIIHDDQKVIVLSSATKNKKECPICGFNNNASRFNCYDCGHILTKVKTGPTVLEYRNLDKVIEDIRKEESAKLKLDNVELEKQLDSTEFKLNKVTNTLKNVENIQAQDLTDAKRDVRERYQKEMKEIEKSLEKVINDNEEKIDELVEEIQKLEENKTDVEVEEARKQEIVDLKTQVTELETVITEAQAASTPRMKKFWKQVADRKEKRKLVEEKEAKQKRIDQISNSYPKNIIKTKPWWRKGKYAKNTEDRVSEVDEARGGLWQHIVGSKSASPSYGW